MTTFTVDHWGQPVATIDARGDTTRLTYEANGLPIRTVFSADPAAVDTAAYNANGVPIYTRPAGGVATTYYYNGTWVTQADSVKTTGVPIQRYFVGSRGRVDSLLLGSLYKQRYTYESRGRVTRVTDALGAVVHQTGYSGPLGNRSADTIPGPRVTTYGYDGYGRATTVTATGLPTRTTYYNVVNRADSVRDGVNATATRFTYDANGNVLSVRDPAGQVYGFAYNALDWVTARTDPAGKADTVKYDVDGLLREWKNRRAQTTRYSYDVLHRQTGKGGTNTDSTAFGFSANRRVVMAQSRVGASVTVIDSVFQSILGTVDSAVTSFGTSFTRRRIYTYTASGVVDSVRVVPFSGSTFLTRKYFVNTGVGVLDSVRIGTKTTGSRFDANLRDTSSIFAGGDTLSRSYLSWGPPAAVHAHAPVLQSFDRSLEYDGVGRIRHQFTDPMPEQFSRIFSYDGLGRVVRDTGAYMPYDECTYDPDDGWHCPDSTLVVDTVRSLVYDAVGNVLRDSMWRAVGVDTAVTGSYQTGNRITSFNGCSYATDLDGNVTSRTCGSETVTFWWSSENRLDSLAVGGVKTKFYYDAANRLVKRDANGAIRYFWWDGDNLYAELTSSGAKLVEYSYRGPDHLHAVATPDSTVYFGRRDGVGNVIGLVDAAKAVRAQYGPYPVWGALGPALPADTLSGGGRNRARFKGALWMGDVAPELYYMRARWYEPRTGRFLSEDPMGLAAGINPYTFADGNPVSLSDPSGRNVGCTYAWGIETCYELPDLELRAMLHLLLRIDGSGPAQPEYDGVGGGGGPGGLSPSTKLCLSHLGKAAIGFALDASGVSAIEGIRALRNAARVEGLAGLNAWRAGTQLELGNLAQVSRLNKIRQAQLARAAAYRAQGILSISGQEGIAIVGLEQDEPTWLKLAKLVPILGTGIELGQAFQYCGDAILGE